MKNYGELKAAVANWLNREDLTTEIVTFIGMAENRIFRDPRSKCSDTEYLRAYTSADDPFNPITLPENFREALLVTVNNKPLEYISDAELFQRQSTNGDRSTDRPQFFTLINRALHIFPWPESTKTVQEWGDNVINLHYYGAESLESMSGWNTSQNPVTVPPTEDTYTAVSTTDTNTNRMLQRNPDVYLFATLVEAAVLVKDQTWLQYYEGRYQEALTGLQREHRRQAISGSTMQVSSVGGDQVGYRNRS